MNSRADLSRPSPKTVLLSLLVSIALSSCGILGSEEEGWDGLSVTGTVVSKTTGVKIEGASVSFVRFDKGFIPTHTVSDESGFYSLDWYTSRGSCPYSMGLRIRADGYKTTDIYGFLTTFGEDTETSTNVVLVKGAKYFCRNPKQIINVQLTPLN